MTAISNWPDGCVVHEHDTLGSTNDEAGRLACAGEPDGTVVWARRQTAGRGRRGRRWDSPAGNLYFSVITRPETDAATGAQLSFVAAVALAESIASFLPDSTRIEQKWPNDVLVNGRKISGILLESAGAAGHSVAWIVVGCGINVAQVPDGSGAGATSLAEEGGSADGVDEVLARVLKHLWAWRGIWDREGFGPIREAWLARARGLGDALTARLPGRELQGRFAGMDDAGALLLELPGGDVRRIAAGEVYYGGR